jgi:membrane-bound metal-dependent hydrolase YbcI (DUF457 family)
MRWHTHGLFGMNSLWLLTPLPNTYEAEATYLGLLAVCAAFGALFPDLDASESKVNLQLKVAGVKPFMLPATTLHQALGHRGLLHSLTGLALICAMALPLAFWWGWLDSSHLRIRQPFSSRCLYQEWYSPAIS